MTVTVRRFLILSSLMLAVTEFVFAGPAHTFHTSLMQVEFDQSEQLVEISVQVFTHDLENALTRRSGKAINLERSPDAPKLVMEYLNDAINIKRQDGHVKVLSWVGIEPQADTVWIYVEAKMAEGFERIEIRNRVLFELFDDQVNRVRVKNNGKKYDLVFKQGDGFKSLPD